MNLFKSKQNNDSTNWTDIPQMGADELSLQNQFTNLGSEQAQALSALLRSLGQPTSIGLDPASQALVDQAFTGANQGLQLQGQLMVDQLASTRGLNRSDTPVSGAVASFMLPQLANLQSQKAAQTLGLGLNMAQMNQNRMALGLQGVGSLPGAGQFNLNRMQQERFARGVQHGTANQSTTPSLMNSIQQGLQIGSQAGGMLAGGYSGISGLGGVMSGMGGMGSGASNAMLRGATTPGLYGPGF